MHTHTHKHTQTQTHTHTHTHTLRTHTGQTDQENSNDTGQRSHVTKHVTKYFGKVSQRTVFVFLGLRRWLAAAERRTERERVSESDREWGDREIEREKRE